LSRELALAGHFLQRSDRHAEAIGHGLREPRRGLHHRAELIALEAARGERLAELEDG